MKTKMKKKRKKQQQKDRKEQGETKDIVKWSVLNGFVLHLI